jgi:hypothetical protein
VSGQRTLIWKMNWYRQSELEGALLLGKMVRAAMDPYLVLALTRHCADEARHACLWADTLAEMALPTVRILRSYQSFYVQEGGLPRTLPEVLALTHVFERRVWRQFTRELEQPELPPPLQAALRQLLDDERQHLDWVSRWLQTLTAGREVLLSYERVDQAVYDQLAPYENRLWEVPGLGVELPAEPMGQK